MILPIYKLFKKFSDLTITKLQAGESMVKTQIMLSNNTCFKLEMLWNGNLVLFRVDDNIALWKSNTSGTQAYKVTMLNNGNFTLTDKNSTQIFWSSMTSGNIGAFLSLQDDGNLVIKTILGSIVWSSNTNSNCTGTKLIILHFNTIESHT